MLLAGSGNKASTADLTVSGWCPRLTTCCLAKFPTRLHTHTYSGRSVFQPAACGKVYRASDSRCVPRCLQLLPLYSANQVMKAHSLQRVPTMRMSVIGQEGACSILYNQVIQTY